MQGEAEAAFTEFINLWNSSESLMLAIRSFIQGNQSRPSARKEASGRAESPITGTDKRQRETKVTERLIKNGVVSPKSVESRLTNSYGGLSRKDVLFLLEKHKAGKRNLGTYLLVRAWKKKDRSTVAQDARLEQLTLRSIEEAIRGNRADFFSEIADTLSFLQAEEYESQGNWDHDPGMWWQFHLLLYVLEHPKPQYPIREFLRHFRDEVGTNEMPTTKTIRKFCRDNGISLDSKPGAPKKSPN